MDRTGLGELSFYICGFCEVTCDVDVASAVHMVVAVVMAFAAVVPFGLASGLVGALCMGVCVCARAYDA